MSIFHLVTAQSGFARSVGKFAAASPIVATYSTDIVKDIAERSGRVGNLMTRASRSAVASVTEDGESECVTATTARRRTVQQYDQAKE